jgi:hypothetical protein
MSYCNVRVSRAWDIYRRAKTELLALHDRDRTERIAATTRMMAEWTGKSVDIGDYRTAAIIQREINEINGLHVPAQVQVNIVNSSPDLVDRFRVCTDIQACSSASDIQACSNDGQGD